MSDKSHITRDDLVAIGFAIYSSLHSTIGKEPLTPQLFGSTCEEYMKKFSETSDE